jgi:hypothetical protein
MQYNETGSKYKNYYLWEQKKNSPYDYENHGLLKYIMSNKIVSSNNPILKFILIYYEKSLIFVMKYIDRLKHFKNYHWKNR